jgi:phosphoglucomutase
MSNSLFRIKKIPCKPYDDQRPGTAGLRKKVTVFQQPHYLESFVHAILTTAGFTSNACLIIGGDGRFFNLTAIQIIAKMAPAYNIRRLIIGKDGILSTPAASNLIRIKNADGGIILTASHNPGGPDGDFGIKFNTATGGQAPEYLADQVYAATKRISSYRVAEIPEFSLSRVGEQDFGGLIIEIVDPVEDYLALMEGLFDFGLMADFIAQGERITFDAMHGVTGPYAVRIFSDRLGLPEHAILHAECLSDFGGLHPDPNPVDAAHLVDLAFGQQAPAIAAASDADGDRNMILGPGQLVSPGDSVAVMLAQANKIPGYQNGIPGVARSMPTSQALDAVAQAMNIPCFVTPTGWRFFCNLLEAGKIGLCGEESFGTGSSHTREKDGLWAILFWLNLLAVTKKSIPAILKDHWHQYGRHYYQRHDFFIPDSQVASALIHDLTERLHELPGTRFGNLGVLNAEEFLYVDPVDHSRSAHQGVQVHFNKGARAVFRLSGTGTAGATLRVYLEQFIAAGNPLSENVSKTLEPLAGAAARLARIKELTGLTTATTKI